jgi:tryptophanyl-tRNA synthetase
MGLFSYPILMAADILMFKATKVPVGRDQVQHLEMARDIALRVNHHFGDLLVPPEAVVDENTAVLTGLDGRKMSKSYNNTIPLFLPEKKLRKLIMKIKTDTSPPDAPKDPESSSLFGIYQAFADPEAVTCIRRRYAEGISWGEMKQILFETINAELAEPRRHYEELIADPVYIESVLQKGARRAREYSVPFLAGIRHAVGIRPIGG